MLRKNMEAYLRRTGQTAADAGVATRRVIAITRGGVEAAERIRDRALTQRDASRAETAARRTRRLRIQFKLSLFRCSKRKVNSTWRRTSGTSLNQPWSKARSDLQEEQQRARKLETGRAASEARAAELGKTLA